MAISIDPVTRIATSTGYNLGAGGHVYWTVDEPINTSHNFVSKTVRLAPTVIPIAECVSLDEEGYRAQFGYQNQTAAPVSIPVGPDNMFSRRLEIGANQLTSKLETSSAAFSVRTYKKKTEWQLRGPDGLLRVATALIGTTPVCP